VATTTPLLAEALLLMLEMTELVPPGLWQLLPASPPPECPPSPCSELPWETSFRLSPVPLRTAPWEEVRGTAAASLLGVLLWLVLPMR
jgi:hypothetical protein